MSSLEEPNEKMEDVAHDSTHDSLLLGKKHDFLVTSNFSVDLLLLVSLVMNMYDSTVVLWCRKTGC